jgi:alginate O-acetyltransferase complex protein AlgI
MLFSSPEFIFIFLPVALVVYFFLAKSKQPLYARYWLLFASIFFYGYWNPKNVILIAASMVFNFYLGSLIGQKKEKWLLAVGITINLAVLFYFKYVDFFLANTNALLGTNYSLLHIVLPLGISFFTFQQIAFLVDSYQGETGNYKFHDYCLFVTFFPQLIAGPIVHHAELMPQFEDASNGKINYGNLAKGLFVFNMGLAKKIIIADTFAVIANKGYANTEMLSTLQAWLTSVSYSIQLYFDFSGYSDMAIGLGLLFNVHIPLNFNSPYRAQNVQDFWRRWHITLSRFLRDYVYIPLGGSRSGESATAKNLLLTFVLGGIWHGAGWTFIFWGFLHGVAQVIYRLFAKTKINVPVWLAIALTFLFINLTWIFFRAPSWSAATTILSSIVGLTSGHSDFKLVTDFYSLPIWLIGIGLLFGKSANEWAASFQLNRKFLWMVILLIIINCLFLNSSTSQEFLYFDF